MQRKPLKNIRVLELGGYISVPYASSLLSALGAEHGQRWKAGRRG